MNDEYQGLVEIISRFNRVIGEKYTHTRYLPKKLLVKHLENRIDKIRQIPRYPAMEITSFLNGRGLVGVDGSVNTMGSTYPHYFSVMQALSKSTIQGTPGIFEYDIHCPLIVDAALELPEESGRTVSKMEQDERQRTAKLANLELRAAQKALEQLKPAVMMMDGSLMRYRIYGGDQWERFKLCAVERNVIVVGIIEEIKTNLVAKALRDDLPESMRELYDRELLFGLLSYGEILMMKNTGEEKDIKKCFIRSSKDPHVIGMDMIREQEGQMLEIAGIVLSLTLENSRGIPIWLDMVDREVRITDEMMNALMDTYLDPDIKSMLFVPKRGLRNY